MAAEHTKAELEIEALNALIEAEREVFQRVGQTSEARQAARQVIKRYEQRIADVRKEALSGKDVGAGL